MNKGLICCLHWGSSWKAAAQKPRCPKSKHFCKLYFFVSVTRTDPIWGFQIICLVDSGDSCLPGTLAALCSLSGSGGPELSLWWTRALSSGPVLAPVANSRLASPPLPYSLLGGAGMAAFLSFVSWVSFLTTCTLHPTPILWGATGHCGQVENFYF